MQQGKTNREYKDRLFKFIFGNPDNREWTLELYNAINGSSYENSNDIKYNTIDDAIYMNMRNDVSFIIENTMNLYEHQATYCPNMPLRFLMYLAKLYDGYSQRNDFNIYSKKLQEIPRPKCICFYNGLDKKEDISILRLSDMYFKNTKKQKEEISGIVELEVVMVNVNYGHNKELLDKCAPLYEYSFFVDRIRFHSNTIKKEHGDYVLEEAIDMAIEDLPKKFKILEFILAHKAEVKAMCLFEYDQEKAMQAEREEGREEGKEEGREEGREKAVLELVHEGLLDKKVAAKKLGITVAKLEEKLKAMFG